MFCFYIASLVTGCCYKLLENPSAIKNKTTKDLIFNLLGIMIKKYNHGLGKNVEIIHVIHRRKLVLGFGWAYTWREVCVRFWASLYTEGSLC